ncbi:MAG: hypothetical protein ACFBSE_13430 [Prochloraceae cyanobacterium]
MSNTIEAMFGFLGGTIVALDSGYKVLQNPAKSKIYKRLSDAKWFLALRWCDNLATPGAILTNTGEFSFYNEIVLDMGEESFIPRQYREDIFARSLLLLPNQKTIYAIDSNLKAIEIQAIEIDARYGKVALLQQIN